MNSKYLALSALVAAASAKSSDHWAVIVAGSSGFWNYRHQADTCHAYQILIDQGYSADQIIHLSFDDVADNFRNPVKGKLFNKPTPVGTPGNDVYAGCKIDYTRNDVTAANVVSVLKGDAAATKGKKVLKSDSNSEVFFYFADHGAPGLVAMPTGGYLYADQLHETLKYMHTNKMYKKMTIYIEACESGSMFENILESNLNIYAVTAANAHESSWGNYCSPDNMVDGKSIKACLGDVFSTNWLEDADKAKMSTETLQDQYNTVKKETAKSHVLQWGDLSWTSDKIGEFESANFTAESKKSNFWNKVKHIGKNMLKDAVHWDEFSSQRKNDFAVDSRDIKLHYLYYRVKEEPSSENMEALQQELKARTELDNVFAEMFPVHMQAIKDNAVPNPTDFDCLRDLVDQFGNKCTNFDDYSLKWIKALVAECEGMKSFPAARQETLKRIEHTCQGNSYMQSIKVPIV